MQLIIATIKPGESGPIVANLQDALQLLLDRGALLPNEEGARRKASAALEQERADQIFSDVTRKLVGIFQEEQRIEASGVVDEATAKLLNHLIKKLTDSNIPDPDTDIGTSVPPVEIDPTESSPRVYGIVLDSNGKPVQNANVQAFDRDLRKIQLLGTDQTKANGEFTINYQPADFQSGDSPSRRTPWLIVEVRENTEGEVLARQELRQAKSVQYLEFRLSGPVVSECQRIGEAIAPLLKGQGTTINEEEKDSDLASSDLTPVDIDFIVLETGLDRVAVEAWVASSRMARDAAQSLAKHDYSDQYLLVQKYGWCFFYGLVRQGLANDLSGVLRESSANWQRSWRAALSANRVPNLNEEDLKLLVAALELLQRLQQLDAVQNPSSDLARVLAHTPLPTAVALDALVIFQKRGLNDADALLKLIDHHPRSEVSIKTFVRSVRVHQLVSGHDALFKLLNTHLATLGTPKNPLLNFLSASNTDSGNELDSIAPLAILPATAWMSFADQVSVSPSFTLGVQAEVEKMHPLIALQARINAGDVELPDNSQKEILAFIKKQGDVAEKIVRGEVALKDFSDASTPMEHKLLLNIGRFQRTGLNLEITGLLIESGIPSPAAAIEYGRDATHKRVKGKRTISSEEFAHERVDVFYDYIESSMNGANGAMIDMAGAGSTAYLVFANTPYGTAMAYPDSVKKNIPNLINLLGDLDECYCRPCESMLSQSAYLVDLLNQLKKCRDEKNRTKTALDALELRRGNITTLQLSCENSEKEIKHIEIVLEILGKAVGDNPYQLTASSIFPWRLPFELPYAEVNAYLAKLGRTRLELLTLIKGADEAEARAAETLGVSMTQEVPNGAISEWDLMTQMYAGNGLSLPNGDHNQLWKIYGFSPNAGSVTLNDPVSGDKLENKPVQEVLQRVSVLMHRTGLSLDDLEKVLATEFIRGLTEKITISNREKCKTSEMLVLVEPAEFYPDCLDRLHRFVRLHAKLSKWSIEQLNRAIIACDGLAELNFPRSPRRQSEAIKQTVINLAIIKRLSEQQKLPLEYLLDLPASENKLSQSLEFTAQQFTLLKKMTGLNLSAPPVNWKALEKFCDAIKSIRESGLSVEQVAAAVLPRNELMVLGEGYSLSFKTDEQIEKLLSALQQRLRSVIAIRTDVTPESQAIETLTAIFDITTTNKLVKAIRDAGAANPKEPITILLNELKSILTGTTRTIHTIGEPLPSLTEAQATKILTVAVTNNLSTDNRFKQLLEDIAAQRRKHELVAAITEQCGLPEADVRLLLSSRLMLNNGDTAFEEFLASTFWDATIPPRVSLPLHTWMDRLYRFVALTTALKMDSELMRLADRVAVSNRSGINWRDILATPSAVYGADWKALMDLLWLQRAEQLSRGILYELLDKLEARSSQTVEATHLQSLATRVGISEVETLAIANIVKRDDATTPLNAAHLRHPSQLRRVFELLLHARYLGADGAELLELSNLKQNVQAATTTQKLLQAQLDEDNWKKISQEINDQLSMQRRDALVAYLIHRNEKFHDVNNLYEHYLIDPQVESCLVTTSMLEAITATQLFAQRILFGLEDITADQDFKDRWTWMRNYRVWEANRRVFLFPENWMFPELRDDKSSSFKQLESALGQGELTQDLARQSFGQFLDDVAQMGQVEVLGMYEDISRYPNGDIQLDEYGYPERRTLYVIGRTQNPPYAYFWRQCTDFGSPSPYIEWSPWQRIELDIQGDHVLPFVLGGELHVAWPVIRAIKIDTGGAEEDGWEVKFAWSRHDGKSWKKSSVSREFWSDKAVAFSEQREGFAFRCETTRNGDAAKLYVYALAKIGGTTKTKPPSIPIQTKVGDIPTYSLGDEYRPWRGNDSGTALTLLSNLIIENYNDLPTLTKQHLEVYAMINKYWGTDPAGTIISGGNALYIDLFKNSIHGNRIIFSNPKEAYRLHIKALGDDRTLAVPDEIFIKAQVSDFMTNYLSYSTSLSNYMYFNKFVTDLDSVCTRRIISCNAWMRITGLGGVQDLVVLYGDEGSYSCIIDGQNLTPGGSITVTKLGGQASASYTLDLDVGGVKLPCSTETLGDLPVRKLARPTLNFEIDGTNLTPEQLTTLLRRDISSQRELRLVSEFNLSLSDLVTRVSGNDATTLVGQVVNAQPWMNGFQENPSGQMLPFTISGPNHVDVNVFNPSGESQFWAVGATSSMDHDAISLSWHYTENGVACYVDVGYRFGGLAGSGHFVYPDSYPEATLRHSDWFQYQTIPLMQAQVSTFGAEKLPVPRIGNAANWNIVKTGAFAFDACFPYACYNWEVFFHAPLLIADQLSKQHKFEDAERWLRYVFDPTSNEPDAADRKPFFKFRVFKELNLREQVIDDLTALAQVAGDYATDKDVAAVEKLIDRWRDAPFRPFLIARRRHIAFLWQTLFAYLDNLIAWADSLYRRDTRESINEAAMLYVLAQRILGRRPQIHQGTSKREIFSYKQKAELWDDFANTWIDIGTRVTSRNNRKNSSAKGKPLKPDNHKNEKGELPKRKKPKYEPSPEGMLYFCMPFNDKISTYWGNIDSRLADIRHCRNIEGIERSLPFTDPRIDPELLVRATAAGLDLGDVIAGLYAPPPHYRYSILSARAAELTNESKALGAALLSAIEKRDAEQLSQLRSSNEISVLKLVQEVRKLQITETARNLDALEATRRSVSARYSQYQRLIGKKDPKAPSKGESTGEESMLGRMDSEASQLNLGLINAENQQIEHLDIAQGWAVAGGITKGVAGTAHMATSILHSALPTKPAADAASAIAHGLSTVGDMFDLVSRGWQHGANKQSILGGHIRRRDEWAFQSNQALKELQQIDKQILANQIRIDITKKELDNHIKQIEQAKAVDEVMRSKFSNEQLYQWMISQISGLYFSTYRMALDMARRAERAAQRELGVKPLNIMGNDYWDSLRSGLLAGERLHQDIRRLEIAYLDQNRREYELTKHISLRRLNPKALVNLRIKDTHGHCRCDFELPEWLFDLDTPGHYLRRIKSVSVSIPCVVGPYANVNCKLTLLKSEIRHDKILKDGNRYLRDTDQGNPIDDDRFIDYFGASEAIVTSTGNADSGMFETQLRDERFLPFESSGVISSWRLELPGEYPQFDYSTISDVILSIRYTAREGGDELRNAATTAIGTLLTPPPVATTTQPTATTAEPKPKPLLFSVVLSCRSDFPTEWAHAGTSSDLVIPITRNLLPYWMDAAKLVVRKVLVADLVQKPTAPPEFKDISPPTGLDTKGEGKVNLGRVSGVVDRIVLLSVGKTVA